MHVLRSLLIFALLLVVAAAARAQTEPDLIRLLQSEAGPVRKAEACKQLRLAGTAQAVPALAALLEDERLSQAARYALEGITAPEADRALREALGRTSGTLQAGVADSLGWKRDSRAVASLVPLLQANDPTVACAAASALGRIGGAEALAALETARSATTAPTRTAVSEALLQAADQCLAEGRAEQARRIYASLQNPHEPDAIRVAAWAGLMRAAGRDGLALIEAALKGDDGAAQVAALELAGRFNHADAARTFAALLPQLSPAMRVGLLTVLRERGEASVLPAVLEQAGSSDAAVRVAALNALGVLGDTNAVPVLALAATSRERREREVAQQALASLRGDQVSAVMVAGLRQSPPELQRTLAQALSSRGERTVVPSLLSLARETDGETRSAALLALGGLVEGSDVDSLVQLIAVAPDLESKMDVVRVFEALAAGPAAGRIETAPIVAALARGDSATRQTLLQVCALFRQDALRAPFRAALHDEDERVRAAAALALCDTQDEALLPDLLEVARRTQDPRLRNLALEGVVRLASEESAPLTVSQRTDALAAALELAARAEDRRRVLSGLARVPDLAALRLTERATADAAVRVEAELACLQIAQAVGEDNFEAVATMLRRLAAAGSSAELRTQAEGLLRKFDSGWLVAGPYRQEGKECQELFDLPFPPERDDAQGVWRRLPGASRPRRPGVVDLASLTGGDHCVLYLQTRVYSPVPQAVTFSLGVDEGIKLWVNGELVHAHNTGRGLTPDQDRAAGRLRQGWNELRAKITHHTGGCSLLLRILDEDGKETPGLRQDPRGVAAPADCGFQRLQLADEFYTEGAYWADFNRDGKLDVVAGPFWFAGPEFKRRHAYREVKAFSPRQYSDNFLTYAGDVNRDGWVDILCVPFPGREGYWCENPGDGSAPWRRHLYARLVGNESPVWADVTGDGWPELVFNVDGYLGYAGPDPAAPTELWPFVAISAQDTRYQRFTHGVGCGDINGDGRADIVERVGWWEQPAVITPGKPWTFHPFHFADAAAQILIYDVNGDGARDLITTWHCHKYGLLWYEQVRRAGRAPDWKPHVILPPEPDLASSELRVSQLHAFDLADMNGDGLLDVVTGKRFWAHGPAGDPEPNAPAVLYWFELRREGGRAEFIPHLIDDDSGVGTQVTAADLNGDTRPDVVVGNKKGVFIHFNQLAHRAPGSHPSP